MKIAIVGNWYGRPQGHCYVARDIVDILMNEGHEVHMYRIGNNEISKEFPQPTTLKSYNNNVIPQQDFEAWLDDIKPEWCVFMEYLDWWTENHDKLDICKQRNIKTTGFLTYERMTLNNNNYDKYTKSFCLSKHHAKILTDKGFSSIHIPWGINLKEIDDIKVTPNDKLTFYHCAGAGGAGGRKNTQAVVDAYNMIKDDNTELVITHLGSKIYSRVDILKFIKLSDVVVNTAKWESLGLGTLEANACSVPVMVCNTEPMNELIINKVNGFLVDGEKTTNSAATCSSYEVNIDKLAEAMTLCKDKKVLEEMKKNARKHAEKYFDWETNKKVLLELFK